MNSTRKIEGYLTAHDANGPGYELGSGAGFGSFWEGDPTKFLPDALPVTLIIGKGYTEEEVKAIIETVRLEAVAAVNAMSNWHRGQRSQPPPPVAYVIDKAVELKYGITPP